MQSAFLTYILQCKSCGIHGEIDEFTATYICPGCQGEMKLSEVRISGDDSSIDTLLDQMIDSAEGGDIVSQRTLAFLADSPNEHTRTAVGNALYRKKYPESISRHEQLKNTNTSIPAQNVTSTSNSSTQTGLSWNGQKTINVANLPARRGQIIINANKLTPRHMNITVITSNNQEGNMKNKILIELDSDYEIRGQMTAFVELIEEKKESYVQVHLLADIESPAASKNPRINIVVYDKDNDIIARDHTWLDTLIRYGSNTTRLPDYAEASRILLRTKQDVN